jgi:KaiC/GvpD/RAD55 family RecA-like ATPase
LAFSAKEMKEPHLYLIIAPPADLRNKNIELIRELDEEGYFVMVITTNQLCDVLKKNYGANGIRLDRIWFVDAVTKYAMGREPPPAKNCRFVSNPGHLTDLGIAITETLKELSGKKVCLLFDSVNAMLIYLSSRNITRFMHFVTNKLRLLNVAGIFLAVEKGLDPDLLVQLITLVDEVIDTDKEVQKPG